MMTGSLQNIFTTLLCFVSQWKLLDGVFNLYEKDGGWIVNTHDYNCIFTTYHTIDITASWNAFCLRPDASHIINADQQQPCFGQIVSFKQLQSMNIVISDLFTWNAPMKTIESYSKYLSLSQQSHENVSYCKCLSSLRFGEKCQYEFDSPLSDWEKATFANFLEDSISTRNHRPADQMKTEYVTCFVGIPCHNSFLCLDWRQICNGVVDCDHGDDEILQLCSQIELHECDPAKEFRCQNGMCIPINVWHDELPDCPDKSDEKSYADDEPSEFLNYFISDELTFDEIICSGKQYSCGNGQCISYTNAVAGFLTGKNRCQNQRNIMQSKQLFAPTSNSTDLCWTLMMCLTGFAHLHSNLVCSNQNLASDIEKNCPNQFFFPPRPVIYSFVYFLYEKTNQTRWSTYSGPDYICFDKAFCLNHTLMSSTVVKANLTCFSIGATIFSWTNFYEYVLHLFSSCYATFSTAPLINKIDSRMLFRCHLSNTFITNHRVKNKIKDCFYGEDEDAAVDFCLIESNDKFYCLNNRTECIRHRFIADGVKDCADASDEYNTHHHRICSSKVCMNRDTGSEKFYLYPFDLLCDNIVDYQVISDQGNETDETHCEYWPYKCYNSPYTKCNGIWNCDNGIDELNCIPILSNNQIEKAFKCNKAEHYCIQFINNRTNVKVTCLHANRTSDGVIDCIGATDERFSGICTTIYPLDDTRRFYCMNSSNCITVEQVCDRTIDCPFEDDELVCPWLYHSNTTDFHCKGSSSKPLPRCGIKNLSPSSCLLKENLWFCDLSPKHRRRYVFFSAKLDLYPTITQTKHLELLQQVYTHPQMSTIQRISSSALSSTTNLNISIWSCNHGYPVKSVIATKGFLCLCPMSYHGDYCQYQSERITVFLKIQQQYYFNPLTVFRLTIYLLNENYEIVSYDDIVYNHKYERERYLVYLPYERLINTSLHERAKSKFVRIDSYIVRDMHVQYISSWFYDVAFPFLPVNRLSVIINLEDESFVHFMRCNKKCGARGKCMYYLNAQHKQYCRCDHGWFGDRCHLRLASDICYPTACAPHSQCVVLNQARKLIQCICPLGRSGDQCYITYNPCSSEMCENDGTCLPLDQRSFEHLCICSDDYTGYRCESRRPTLNILIGTELSQSDRIPAANVIKTKVLADELIQHRALFMNIRLPTVIKAYGLFEFGFIQIFHNFSTKLYYVIAILETRPVTLNTSVIEDNRCQNITNIFNKTILNDYSYLKRLKLYHLPCKQNHKLRCFFDEYRMCSCNTDRTSNCFIFDHSVGKCDYCQNDGLCVQQDELENRWQYICICAPCSFGSLCQFSTGNYYLTLDILVGNDIKPGVHSFSEQPKVILLVLIILATILAFSLVSNLTSFFILSDRNLQQVGCDVYLLAAVLTSELGVIALFLRYLYMIIIQMYVIENFFFMKFSCLVLEYLIRLIPSLFDWLTACMSIERTYMIIQDVHFTKMIALRTHKLARWIVALVISLNVLSTLHRLFYLTLVGEPVLRGGFMRHPWCILRFNSKLWNIYERFINIFHLIVPFSLNLVAIICFIVQRAKLELTSSVRNHKRRLTFVIRRQLSKYKTILISTVVIIIVEIPRLVLTFTYGCTQQKWHRNAYLVGYLVSYVPLTLIFFIYVLPSPKYRNRFRQMLRTNRLTRRFIKSDLSTRK